MQNAFAGHFAAVDNHCTVSPAFRYRDQSPVTKHNFPSFLPLFDDWTAVGLEPDYVVYWYDNPYPL